MQREGEWKVDAVNKALSMGGAECAQRESARGILLRRAEIMRRDAMNLIKKADGYEQLANSIYNVSGDAEAALWRIVAES